MIHKQTVVAFLVVGSMARTTLAGEPSCPTSIPEAEVRDTVGATPRLFTLAKSQGSEVEWDEIDLQRIKSEQTAFLFYDSDFGPQVSNLSTSFPCAARRMVELESAGKFAYLADCSPASPSIKTLTLPAAILSEAENRVTSGRYSYDFFPNNQLLFRKLQVRRDPQSPFITASSEAEMLLHLDIQNFFTLNFTNKSVESYLTTKQEGIHGTAADIAFFVRILMFKVSIKMQAMASFFNSSANIPVAVDVPVDARSTLNNGSGMLYSWKNEEARIDRSRGDEDLPRWNASAIKHGPDEVAKIGLRYCKNGICIFKLRGSVKDMPYALNINVPIEVVKLGFFPLFVDDIQKFKRELEWDDDPQDKPGRVAMFFPNNGLPKGQYRLDHWIRMGQDANDGKSCPGFAKIGRSLKAPDLAH